MEQKHIQMDYYSVRSDAESRTVYSVLYECVVKSVLVSKLRKVVYHFKYINNKQQQQKNDVVNTE